MEAELRELVAAQIGRGRVELGVFLRRDPTGDDADNGATPIDPLADFVDPGRLRGLLAALASIERASARASLELSKTNALELLRFLTHSNDPLREASLEPPGFLPELVGVAVGELSRFRAQEGGALAQALSELVLELEREIADLHGTLPGEQARLQERAAERLRVLCEVSGVAPPEPARVAQEVALLLARGDLAEEIARIGSHIEQMRHTLAAPAAKGQGKTLDFLTQELMREVTTIGSKITSHDGSRLVIAAKGTVERIREQVQNVE